MNYLKIIEKYYTKGSPLYNLLISHSTSVSDKAISIVDKHNFKVDREFVKEAAMMHDIGIFKTNAPSILCFGEHEYIEHGYLGADLLRKEGYPKHALVCERHTGTGISLEEIIDRKLPLPHRDMNPISLEEQIICYADLFYSKTKPNIEITIRNLRKKIALWGGNSIIKFEEWHNMFN